MFNFGNDYFGGRVKSKNISIVYERAKESGTEKLRKNRI
jgi:hypothetical protein